MDYEKEKLNKRIKEIRKSDTHAVVKEMPVQPNLSREKRKNMFQDIMPYTFRNEYEYKKPTDDDYVIICKEHQVLLCEHCDKYIVPKYNRIRQQYQIMPEELTYLFCIDECAFYLYIAQVEERVGFAYKNARVFRELKPAWLAFAGATAMHLAEWYDVNRFCGRCQGTMRHKKDERAVVCPDCGNLIYPRISPAVIVGVIDKDKVLLTKYAHDDYKKHALIAGFMEIGEAFEETVKREVMEEVGINVKNIRYYKSQPWAFSGSVLAGFFAEPDGSTEVHVDQSELKEAVWFSREELPHDDTTLSLTWEMIEVFRRGEE